MNRIKSIQQIYARLAELELYREETRQQNKSCDEIDLEIDAVRATLEEFMHRFGGSPEGFSYED